MLAINHNALAGTALKAAGSTRSALEQSIERLSSGLRINSAKDDAAGLGITNRMTANINADSVVSRGLDDAISLAQTAEGSLGSVSELLIRAKSLAVQSATDTLSESDRRSVDAEYQHILAAIMDISEGTQIFGQFPLATNNPVLPPVKLGDVAPINVKFPIQGNNYSFSSGIIPLAYLPAGGRDITITIDSLGLDDDLQIFTRDGKHLAGTPINGSDPDYTWTSRGITDSARANARLFSEANGFAPGAAYDDTDLIEGGATWALNGSETLNFNGMTITYSGDGDRYEEGRAFNDGSNGSNRLERIRIDNVTEDLIVMVVGSGSFTSNLTWGDLPAPTIQPDTPPIQSNPVDIITQANYGEPVQSVTLEPTPTDIITLGLSNTSMLTQSSARTSLTALDNALETVSGYRSQYGAWINRFESGKSTLAQQNLASQAARSRINDADYALEASQQIKAQILQQSQVAVLKVAQQIPETVLTLLRN
ncbi:flagellin [Enterobacter sp. BIGb0383]|uniref:flagellin N-terminal helical domain-containing protein n=1 Tax=unclassified Enterobacter TaxID=2608935 RepID=UPI000F496D89|nr:MULTISPECIES: flagellin [unclassified Enterobacter]ROP62423.1 flagellin [Enterobacter sp. BIGb0383]ROS12583.1 flagellin [Enterobacter sp. BIGb0359]